MRGTIDAPVMGEYSFPWRSRLIRGVGSLCLAGVSLTGNVAPSHSQSEPGLHAAAPTPPQPFSSMKKQPEGFHDTLDDLQMVIINDPEFRLNTDTTKEQARDVLNEAGNSMSDTTNGALQMPMFAPIHSIDHLPTGMYKEKDNGLTMYCISDADINDARKKAFRRDGVPLSTRTAVIINGNPSCRDNEAAAWATRSDTGANLTVYSQNFTPFLVEHEEGHVAGLQHTTTIDCSPKLRMSLMELSKIDIQTLLQDKKCLYPFNKDGKKDDYADEHTVMGDKYPGQGSENVYDFVEINQLSPRTVQIADVLPVEGRYHIGIEKNDLHGIRLALPEGHPLRDIDPSLRYLNIGFESIGSGQIQSRIIASGEGVSYSLEYTFPYIPNIDAAERGKVTLYTDSSLGIAIAAEGVKNDEGDYFDQEGYIDVESIPR